MSFESAWLYLQPKQLARLQHNEHAVFAAQQNQLTPMPDDRHGIRSAADIVCVCIYGCSFSDYKAGAEENNKSWFVKKNKTFNFTTNQNLYVAHVFAREQAFANM